MIGRMISDGPGQVQPDGEDALVERFQVRPVGFTAPEPLRERRQLRVEELPGGSGRAAGADGVGEGDGAVQHRRGVEGVPPQEPEQLPQHLVQRHPRCDEPDLPLLPEPHR